MKKDSDSLLKWPLGYFFFTFIKAPYVSNTLSRSHIHANILEDTKLNGLFIKL